MPLGTIVLVRPLQWAGGKLVVDYTGIHSVWLADVVLDGEVDYIQCQVDVPFWQPVNGDRCLVENNDAGIARVTRAIATPNRAMRLMPALSKGQYMTYYATDGSGEHGTFPLAAATWTAIPMASLGNVYPLGAPSAFLNSFNLDSNQWPPGNHVELWNSYWSQMTPGGPLDTRFRVNKDCYLDIELSGVFASGAAAVATVALQVLNDADTATATYANAASGELLARGTIPNVGATGNVQPTCRYRGYFPAGSGFRYLAYNAGGFDLNDYFWGTFIRVSLESDASTVFVDQ